MSNLAPELQKQIDQEAKAEAKKLTCRVPMFKFGYEGGYGDAGEKYAIKWQEEKELRERYEKALKEIWSLVPAKHDMISIAREALTPKLTTNERRL